MRCLMSPEILIMWSGNMVDVPMAIETSMMWGRVWEVEEDLVVFFGINNCCNNSTGKECSHLIKTGF